MRSAGWCSGEGLAGPCRGPGRRGIRRCGCPPACGLLLDAAAPNAPPAWSGKFVWDTVQLGGAAGPCRGPGRCGIRRCGCPPACGLLLDAAAPNAPPAWSAKFVQGKHRRSCGGATACHLALRTGRPLVACTGRVLLGNSWVKRRSCSRLMLVGCLKTSHNTPSVQGGVVREPKNW